MIGPGDRVAVFRTNPLHNKCWYIVGFAVANRAPRQTSLLTVNLPGLELVMFHPNGQVHHASRPVSPKHVQAKASPEASEETRQHLELLQQRSAGFRDLHIVPSPEGTEQAREHLELFQQRQQQQKLKSMLDAAAKTMDLCRLSCDEQAELISVLERMQRLSTKQRTYPLPGHKREFI